MKKWLKWIAVVWAVTSLAAGIYFWPRIDQWMRFNPSIAEADFPEPAGALEAQRQDFTYLAQVLDYDRSFSDDARKQFLSEVEQLKSRTGEPLSDAAFFLETHRLMALADNAHTSGDGVSAFRMFNRSGMDVYTFEDGIFVVRAHESRSDLLGKRVVEIEGHTTDDLITKLRKYSGGPDSVRDHFSLFLLRSPELLHAAGLISASDKLSVTLEDDNGNLTEHTLQALPNAAETEFAYRHVYHTLRADSLPDEAGEWVNVLSANGVEPPLTLQDDGDLVLSQNMGDALYIRSNYLVEYPGHEVKSQLVEALDGAGEFGHKLIIVDLRWNPGGDLGNAIPFAETLGDSLAKEGKVYVITGPQTFSAAIVTAALVKQYAGGRARIVGEPMGDRPQFWAERGGPFVLPNSDYFIAYSTGYHDWEKPCSEDQTPHCFPASRDEAADIGTLALDEEIRPSFAEYASGKDVVLEWILAQ